jgi:FlaG/FlaF family flagellin (archaellin)
MVTRIMALCIVLAGCVTVSKSVLMDRSAYPIPQQQVQVLLEGDSIPSSCERVALMHASGDENLTDEGDIWDKLRSEAGKLGANVVAIQAIEDPGTGERIAAAIFDTSADRDADAIALWCPDGVVPD